MTAMIVIVIGVVGSVASIISLLLPIEIFKTRYYHAAYLFAVAILAGIATYEATKYARLNDIAIASERLAADRASGYTSRGYVNAVLAFLEKNKDLFPDTYARAQASCKAFKCDDPAADVDMVELSYSFDGIVKGMGAISK
ncbi:hypothetical protein [Bradyrhizobium niftali]|uniref:Uncharacterized protein n=1 Tax=Bradyrhizobium niftali TaxID=2560055 RepID=A0A4Y9LZB2_9BRAD|nr:hypothetical protein [Bradyrhizobium niftali]TFV48269.1 hypothetical protein E4K65_12695 [Bradyrhizobium niftali]